MTSSSHIWSLRVCFSLQTYIVLTFHLNNTLGNCNTEVNSVFNQFMESSTLGEFSSRLQMIFAFHCYLASTVASPECHPVVCTLWHTYNYYRQFLTSVTDYIVKMRVPIEKELKVKQCTVIVLMRCMHVLRCPFRI